RSVLFKRTTELLAKLSPLTVSVNCWSPTMANPGVRLVIVGASGGWVIVNVKAFDGPPPGAGLTTVMLGVPGLATSAALIKAVDLVALTKVVGRSAPFHLTVEVLTKFDPLSVRVNPASVASLVVGLRVVSPGTRLLTVNGSESDVPPPGTGVETVILPTPAVVTLSAGIFAINFPPLYVVTSCWPLKKAFDVRTKLVPFTVTSTPLPTLVRLGVTLPIPGAGLMIVKSFMDWLLHGPGLTTTT